jgi:Pseudouridylate synthase
MDAARFCELAPVFEGEHDFTAFAAADDRDTLEESKVRTIFSSSARSEGDYLIFTVKGSGFLKHMVRNLVGTLLEGSKGNVDAAGIRRFFEPGSRKATPRAPAGGLFLREVEYRGTGS